MIHHTMYSTSRMNNNKCCKYPSTFETWLQAKFHNDEFETWLEAKFQK